MLVTDGLSATGIAVLAERCEVDVRTEITRRELLEVINRYDAVIVRSATRIDADVIEAAHNLKVIARAGTGLDNLDVEAAEARGVLVYNTPQANAISAAEHTIALLLALVRSIPRADRSLRAGHWTRNAFQGIELYGKTLGILGLGHVGKLVAQRCSAFGMNLVAHDKYYLHNPDDRIAVELLPTVRALCEAADILTVHLPKTHETVGIVGEPELRCMKPTALVINTARGGIVDEQGLYTALTQGWIHGAALDVFATEPVTDSPLLTLDNVVVTPHLGASTVEAQERAGVLVAKSVLAALSDHVAPPAAQLPTPGALAHRLRDEADSTAISVGIVGLGPRGLSVLERIVTLASRPEHTVRPVHVEIVDPVGSGVGLHTVDQPDYLLLNTVCSQVDMFPTADSVGLETGEPGLDLYAWVQERGLRLAADGFTVGEAGREIQPNDFLPRRILGEYLAWFLERTLARAPEMMSIRIHRATALALSSDQDGAQALTLSDGTVVQTQFLFFTLGHTPNIPPDLGGAGMERVIHTPYPLPDRLKRVQPGEAVAIAGFGLTAMDVIAALTVGRGGRFVRDGGRARYVPSGREPRMLLYSRTGLPYRARPLSNGSIEWYEPLVFTREGVDRLREGRSHNGLLDFRHDVMPLLQAEMQIAFHRGQATLEAGTQGERRVVEEIRQSVADGALQQTLRRLDERYGTFDPVPELFPEAEPLSLTDAQAYQDWITSFIAADLTEAEKGLTGSPLKVTMELFRDLRNVIRHAVEFGGLTPQSHGEFISLFTPMMNRVGIGPQKERSEELLALFEAGLLTTPFGPAPEATLDDRTQRWVLASTRLATPYAEAVDWICYASAEQPDVERSGSPLVVDLYQQGLIRRHRPEVRQVRGIDIGPDLHPIDVFGRKSKRVWVFGPLCEGATFYNHYVPRPGGFSRVFADAHQCVAEMFATAKKPESLPALTARH